MPFADAQKKLKKTMLIDDVKIKVSSGHGGNGGVYFNKTRMNLGPTGGNGGKGGDLYIEGVSDLSALKLFRFKKVLQAENGENGKQKLNDGHSGKDLILKVPMGTIIYNLTTKEDREIIRVGERFLICRGGKGGKGNFRLRSSTNTTPRRARPGRPGETFDLQLELKFIADVGLVGLPNVGKSSLLNALTNAKSKVANYPFTTLEPNLGVYYGLILADLPGLIEGASMGKGLGIKFLRHIERTKIIFHLISVETENPFKDYQTIRKELETYSKNLLEKPEYIFLTKKDLISTEKVAEKFSILKKNKLIAKAISILDEKDLNDVCKVLDELVKEKSSA